MSKNDKCLLLMLCSLLAILLLPSSGFSFIREEIRFRHTATEDTLDVLVIYHGVTDSSHDEQSLSSAVKTATEVLNGLRVFQSPGPFTINLEKARGDEEVTEQARHLIDCISVVGSGCFLDDQGRLCIYQKVVISNLNFVVESVNIELSRAVLEDSKKGGVFDKSYNERSNELVVAAARNDTYRWFRIDNGILEINFPLSIEDKDRLIEELLTDVSKDKDARHSLLSFLSAAQSVSFKDEQLTLQFGQKQNEVVVLILSGEKEYSPILHQRLEKEGFTPNPDLNLEKVKNLLGMNGK